jgi:anti-sigma B factor antagonist
VHHLVAGGRIMSFSVEQGSDPRAYRLVGELDLATCDELVHYLEPAIRGNGDLRLDLAGVEFMDSSGIHALVEVSRELKHRGRVVLHSPSREMARVFEVIAQIFPNVVIDGGG